MQESASPTPDDAPPLLAAPGETAPIPPATAEEGESALEGPLLAPPVASWLDSIDQIRAEWGDRVLRVVMAIALSFSVHLLVLSIMSVIVPPRPPEQKKGEFVAGKEHFEEQMVEE